MKKKCDEYFFIKHWNEPRGEGGIFFDALNSGDEEKDFNFVKSTADAFLAGYSEIVRRRKDLKWSNEQKEKQYLKRAKYVEFNLLYDRGTRFGFMTGGNPEAILMSMPPVAKWP
jgi:coproporphyrinogen III oxidase